MSSCRRATDIFRTDCEARRGAQSWRHGRRRRIIVASLQDATRCIGDSRAGSSGDYNLRRGAAAAAAARARAATRSGSSAFDTRCCKQL